MIESTNDYIIIDNNATSEAIFNRLSTLLEATSDMCYVYNSSGYLTYVNRNLLATLGYSAEDALGRHCLDFTPVGCHAAQRRELEIRLREGRPGQHETHVIDKNGQIHLIRITALPMLENNQVSGGIALATDITRQRLLEDEDITSKIQTKKNLQRFKEKIAQAESIASLGTLSAGVIHEITQPINALKILTNALIYSAKTEQALSTEKLLIYLGEINNEIMHLEDIIYHMRSLSQAHDPTALQDCDINQCIRNALCLLERQLSSHGIRLKKTFGRNLPKVRANFQSLEIVFINLFVNAMESLDAIDRLDKTIHIITLAGPESVIAQISDNGEGISPDHLSKIFEPFFTTKKMSNNMGLGLSIVRTIISSIDGELSCWNDDSSGATFHVEIPLPG